MYWNLMSSIIRKNRTSDSNRLANRFENIKFKWSIYQRAGCWRNAVNNTTTYSLISFPCGSNHCVFRLLIGILISGHYTLVSLNDTVYVQQSTIKTRGRVLHSQMMIDDHFSFLYCYTLFQWNHPFWPFVVSNLALKMFVLIYDSVCRVVRWFSPENYVTRITIDLLVSLSDMD